VDRWQQDTKRQRVLERAGWTFWRCFAATWSLRRDEVLGELLERLSVMGIEPLGALERAPQVVERRVWMATQSAGDVPMAAAIPDVPTEPTSPGPAAFDVP
jgi:hypothetical protein